MKQSVEQLFINVGQSIELVRILYSNTGVRVYLPHGLVEKLGLQKGIDHSFVCIFDDGLLVLFRDKNLIEELRPQVLEARRLYAVLKHKATE